MAHGFDHTLAGFNSACYNQMHDTATSHLLQKTGMSPTTVSLVDGSISMMTTMGRGGLIQGGRSVTLFILRTHRVISPLSNSETFVIKNSLTRSSIKKFLSNSALFDKTRIISDLDLWD